MANFSKLHIFVRPQPNYLDTTDLLEWLKEPGDFNRHVMQACNQAKDVAWCPSITITDWDDRPWRIDYKEIPDGEVPTFIAARKYDRRHASIHLDCSSDNFHWLGDGIPNNTIMLGANGRSVAFLQAVGNFLRIEYGYSSVIEPSSYGNDRYELDKDGKLGLFQGKVDYTVKPEQKSDSPASLLD